MCIEKNKKLGEKNLEIQAIKKYLEKHQVEQLPVDNLDLSNSQSDIKYMDEPEIYNNIKRRDLSEELYEIEYQHGFMYLNSNQCDDLFEKLYILEENIINNSANEKLLHLYKLWHEIQEKREYEMISNIYKYSYEHTYNKGLFLVGAGHRKSIIDKIQEYEKKNRLKLNWNYNIY